MLWPPSAGNCLGSGPGCSGPPSAPSQPVPPLGFRGTGNSPSTDPILEKLPLSAPPPPQQQVGPAGYCHHDYHHSRHADVGQAQPRPGFRPFCLGKCPAPAPLARHRSRPGRSGSRTGRPQSRRRARDRPPPGPAQRFGAPESWGKRTRGGVGKASGPAGPGGRVIRGRPGAAADSGKSAGRVSWAHHPLWAAAMGKAVAVGAGVGVGVGRGVAVGVGVLVGTGVGVGALVGRGVGARVPAWPSVGGGPTRISSAPPTRSRVRWASSTAPKK